MFELYKSEFLRLRKGTIIGFLGLIVIYFMLPRLGFWEVLHRNMGFLLTVGMVVLSLSFGIFHGLLWRKKNFWIFLIHRPMSPKNIYLSLFGAGVTVICGSILLSLLLTTLSYDLITHKVVDLRHYQFAFYLTLLGIACYMVGTLTVLHRSKFTIIVFYALCLVFVPEPTNHAAQYIPLFFVLGALLYLNLQCFKPDLNQPPASPIATGLIATGTSYGLVVALVLATTIFYHLPLSIVGKHPDMAPQKGAMKYLWKDNFKNGIGYILEDSLHPQAEHYARQTAIAPRRNLPIGGGQPPRKGQFHRFDTGDSLFDRDSGALWKFSHDHMMLLGINQQTSLPIGVIGQRGFIADVNQATKEDAFDEVPHLSGGRYLSTTSDIYTINFESRELILKHTLNKGEYYTSSLWANNEAALISTNKRLLVFDSMTLLDDFSELQVDYEIEYPESLGNSEFAYAIPVADGYLMAFLGENYFGFDRPGAEVFVTRLDGSFEKLGAREFEIHDHPSWIRHYSFLIAPFIFVTEELLMHTLSPYEPRFLSAEQLKAQDYPGSVYMLAIFLQVISIIGVWLLLKRDSVKGKLRWTWLGISTLLGLPAMLSYLLLQPKN